MEYGAPHETGFYALTEWQKSWESRQKTQQMKTHLQTPPRPTRSNAFIRLLAIIIVASVLWLQLGQIQSSPSTAIHTKTPLKNISWESLATEIEALRIDWNVPGLSVGVVHNGRLVFGSGFGVKNEDNEPVTLDTLFQIGSTTKAFTSFLVAQLVDEGKLDWNTSVTSISTAEFMDPVANEQANLIDLMSHRTGLPRHDILMFVWTTAQEILSRIKYLQPSQGFREKWQYNNHMFNLAGQIAANVSGLSGGWQALVKERVFQPIGMVASLTDPRDLPNSKDHSRGFNAPLIGYGSAVVVPYDDTFWTESTMPAGSIMSNINELTRWVSLINNQGLLANGTRLISSEQFRTIMTPHMLVEESDPEDPIQDQFYGLGWALDTYRETPRVQHGGNTVGYSAQIDTYPTHDLGIIVLSNGGGNPAPMVISQTIADRILFPKAKRSFWSRYYRYKVWKQIWKAAKAKVHKIASRHWFTKPTQPLAEFQGIFTNPAYGTVQLDLRPDGKYFDFELFGARRDGFTAGIVGHWEYNVFGLYELRKLGYVDYSAPLFDFEFSEDTSVLRVNLEEGVDSIVFERV
ncbi:beta-lactamase/transpeptidase-like protein [Obelidium mucronatum]|nr:beta-lactamase/transpeptidase-like protein [Obelidium mucronatum]